MDAEPKFSSGNASIRKALNAVVAYARKHGVHPGGRHGWSESPNGWVPPVSTADAALVKLGFTVTRADDLNVKVSPSVVSGVSVIAKMPRIGNTPLDAEETPLLPFAKTESGYVGLRVTITPETEISSDGESYQIKDGAGLLYGEITVEKFNGSEEMEFESHLAEIDSETGEFTERGVFIIPLAKQEADGPISNTGYYFGPLGVRLCSSGTLQVIGPVIVTAEI